MARTSKKLKSVSRRFNYALAFVVIVMLFIFAAIVVTSDVLKGNRDLNQRLAHTVELATTSLRTPLWDLDYEIVDRYLNALFLDDYVAYVAVFEGDRLISQRIRPEFAGKTFAYFEASPGFRVGSSDITRQGEKIGRVAVAISSSAVQKELLLDIFYVLGLIVLITAATSWTSVRITRRYISQRLMKLQESANAIALGNLQSSIEIEADDEIGRLAHDLKKMRDAIKETSEELRNSNAKLETHSQTLERSVEERTREIESQNRSLMALNRVAEVTNRSLQLKETLQAAVDASLEAVEATAGLFRLWDPSTERLSIVAYRGITEEYIRRYGELRAGEGFAGKAFVTGELAIEENRGQHQKLNELAATGPGRFLASIPVRARGKTIGVMSVVSDRQTRFTASAIELLSAVGNQIGTGIENARLFEESLRAKDQLATLLKINQVISSTLDPDKVLSTIVTQAVTLTRTDGGAIYEYDQGIGQFRVRATHKMSDELKLALKATPLRWGEGAVGRAAAARAPVQIQDTGERSVHDTRLFDVVQKAGFRAMLAVPLMLDDRVVGGLVAGRKSPAVFEPELVDSLQTFASQSTLALQNARLFSESEEKGRQLIIASKHKSQFLANMSHELRTPLNAIIGYGEMLREEASDQGQHAFVPDLDRICSAGRHLLSLVDDILDISKIEAGKVELALECFPISVMLEEIANTVRPLVEKNGNTLLVRQASDLGTMTSDPTRLRQSLLNLLSNAGKFTSKGKITLDCERHTVEGRDWITLRVSDTGIGMTAEELPRIFDAFTQADSSTTRQYGGTGLGLPISRHFCRLMGGDLTATSQPKVGSTFTIHLPAEAGGQTSAVRGQRSGSTDF